MSYELIIKKTKQVETALVELGADGKGLHKKLSSIENVLNNEIVKKIRFIASIRNQLVHDDNFKLNDNNKKNFEKAVDQVLNYLNYSKKTTIQETTKELNNNEDSIDMFLFDSDDKTKDKSEDIPNNKKSTSREKTKTLKEWIVDVGKISFAIAVAYAAINE